MRVASQRCADGAWSPTRRDLDILGMLAEGYTVETVARRLDVSERTVRRRLRTMADDLGVDATIQVVVHAVRRRAI